MPCGPPSQCGRVYLMFILLPIPGGGARGRIGVVSEEANPAARSPSTHRMDKMLNG